MKRLIPYFITLAMLTALCPISHGANKATMQIIDSLRTELRNSTTAIDSLPILCNLYDILPREASTKMGDSISLTAMRAGEYRVALDIIRTQASRKMRKDADLNALVELAMRCPDDNDRKETLTFITMMSNMRKANYSDNLERKDLLGKYLKKMTIDTPDDLYDRIALTHGICMMLSDDPNGDLLISYMDSLNALIKLMPSSSHSIRNIYNVHAATLFAGIHPEKSIVADLNFLENVSKLEKFHHENGRIYRNYHPTYYSIYTRLLSNFEVLDTAKVEEYYTKALDQLPYDPSIYDTHMMSPLPEVYHAMFYKDYHKALPLILVTSDSVLTRHGKLQMLKYEIESAKALGDKEVLLEASTEYAKALQDELEECAQSSYRELQTAYAIYEMKYRVGQMEIDKRSSVASLQRIIIIVSACALFILLVLAIFLFLQYLKNRNLANSLAESNQKLLTESENLRQSKSELIRARDAAQKANNLKSDFIKNMSYEVKVPLQAINEYSHLIADCTSGSSTTDSEPPASIRHLSHFADLIELNSELLSTIIDDVLRLAEIDSDSMPLHPQVVNLKLLCENTVASVKHRVKPGVTLSLDPSCQRIDLFTDPTRVQQILNNLLTNATKFTKEGHITLSYSTDATGENVIFTVTDTGIGINPENREKIFDRFVKLDRESQGAGLGLTIGRLIARKLGGDLSLDTSYTRGARFTLTLPKK